MVANAWDQMTGAAQQMGAVTILGDLAAMVQDPTEADRAITKYTQQGYTASDRIFVGLEGQKILAAGVEDTFQAPVSTPFKPERVTIPSWCAPFLVITSIQIGPVLLVDGRGGIPADIFTEVSTNNRISWPTVETSQDIIFRIRNVGVAPTRVSPAVYGVRLRK